jgi:hypothetical protein
MDTGKHGIVEEDDKQHTDQNQYPVPNRRAQDLENNQITYEVAEIYIIPVNGDGRAKKLHQPVLGPDHEWPTVEVDIFVQDSPSQEVIDPAEVNPLFKKESRMRPIPVPVYEAQVKS